MCWGSGLVPRLASYVRFLQTGIYTASQTPFLKLIYGELAVAVTKMCLLAIPCLCASVRNKSLVADRLLVNIVIGD
jgi:hypothetical protein